MYAVIQQKHLLERRSHRCPVLKATTTHSQTIFSASFLHQHLTYTLGSMTDPIFSAIKMYIDERGDVGEGAVNTTRPNPLR